MLPKIKLTLTAAFLTAPLVASASELNYSYLSAGYFDGSAELPAAAATLFGSGTDLDLSGFEVHGQYAFDEIFFGYANYQDGDIDLSGVGSADLTAFTIGFGGRGEVSENADMYFTMGYRYSNWEISGYDESIGHLPLTIGVRWSPIEWLEINPSITHYFPVKDDDTLGAVDTTTLDFKLYYTGHESFQPYVGFLYTLAEDSESITSDMELLQVGLRYNF